MDQGIYVRGGALYWQGVWEPPKILMTAEKCKKSVEMSLQDRQSFPLDERTFIFLFFSNLFYRGTDERERERERESIAIHVSTGAWVLL